MKILWAITGAGFMLDESISLLEKLSQENTITLALSQAATEVIQLYGYNKRIDKITSNKKNSIITDKQQQYSYPFAGKITHEKYDIIVIAPLTANSTAKIVHGIADTLITNIAAQSGKGQIPLYALPCDQKQGMITTTIPPYIDKNKCEKHPTCKAAQKCPTKAIKPPLIDKQACISCHKCTDTCQNKAVIINKQIKIYIRKTDEQNTKKLETIENIECTYTIENLEKKIKNRPQKK